MYYYSYVAMLSLKWIYLIISLLASVMILLLYSDQKYSKPRPKSSVTAFTEDTNDSFPAVLDFAENYSSLKEQADNAQLDYEDQEIKFKFTGSDENSTAIKEGSNRMTMSPALTLPFPSSTIPAVNLLQQQWVDDLWHILSEIRIESSPIHILAGNSVYRELLLNWLIMAKVIVTPPLSNIIILSIDKALCDLLSKRNISCLFVDRKAYLRQNIQQSFHLILILRLTVIRLLNYWGYDAANIDADAIILKNPEPLYEKYKESDMVAGRGTYPPPLGRVWGATICAGTFMIRSTPNTGTYDNMVSLVNQTTPSGTVFVTHVGM